LYQNKNNEVKKADDTVAWSEGNDASGTWFNKRCHTLPKNTSGLSI
jgi:hypothetical protein